MENNMKKINGTLSAIIFSLVGTAAIADSVEVEMLNKRDDGKRMVYSEDITRINVGDTVNWIAKDRGHNVEFIDGPDNWEAPKRSRMSKDFSYTFEEPGIYTYVCTPHASMGMLATVVVGDVTESDIKAVEDAPIRGRRAQGVYDDILNKIREN
jgi:pseudoazurin